MQRADEIYRTERGNQQPGTRLVGLLPETDFRVEEIIPYPKVQTDSTDQVERGIDVQRTFLEANDSFDDTDITAWEEELRELAEADQFLSCGVAFLYIARKPA